MKFSFKEAHRYTRENNKSKNDLKILKYAMFKGGTKSTQSTGESSTLARDPIINYKPIIMIPSNYPKSLPKSYNIIAIGETTSEYSSKGGLISSDSREKINWSWVNFRNHYKSAILPLLNEISFSNNYIIGEAYKDKDNPNKIDDIQIGITGTKNKVDENITDTMKREISEETGLSVSNFREKSKVERYHRYLINIKNCESISEETWFTQTNKQEDDRLEKIMAIIWGGVKDILDKILDGFTNNRGLKEQLDNDNINFICLIPIEYALKIIENPKTLITYSQIDLQEELSKLLIKLEIDEPLSLAEARVDEAIGADAKAVEFEKLLKQRWEQVEADVERGDIEVVK